MVRGWKLDLIRPKEAVEIAVRNGFALALDDLQTFIATDLVKALVFGGFGIQGIAQTPFYRFLSSTDGLSQLGIPATEPPRLLQAYQNKAFKVSKTRTILSFKFGDVAILKLATPHPSSGKDNIQVTSWLEWVLGEQKVDNAGFVPKSSLPPELRKASRLNPPLGGLMLPAGEFGSTGTWSFPPKFYDYDVKWLKSNLAKIESVILKRLVKFLKARLK